MSEFEKGEMVLVGGCEYEVNAGPDTRGNYCLLSYGGGFEIVNAKEIKPKPATININGADVPKPMVISSDSRDGQYALIIDFGTSQEAMRQFAAALEVMYE